MALTIQPILGYVRNLLGSLLQAGDVVIDGTVGNGHDTLFLAGQVGEGGRVYGFDIQQAALDSAKARLDEAGLAERATLLLASHAEMKSRVPAEEHGRVKAITFNLGYLPGGDKNIVTLEASTLPALQAGLDLLAPGGVMTVALYSGHTEGKEEAQAVLAWAQELPQTEAHVLEYRFLNQKNDPPMLLAFEKRDGKSKKDRS
jgi:SAM-dependent methyltransferase